MKLDLSNYVDRMIYLGCYEPLNTYRFKRILKHGMTVVDVGANIGYFSLLSAYLLGASGKVFAVEPHPANFAILREVVSSNGLEQVVCVDFGLGEKEDVGNVLMSSLSDVENRTASMVPPKNGNSFQVRVRTLDNCADEWNIDAIDLLKIDVDGFETAILRGARKLMAAGKIRNIIIEYNDYWLAESGSSEQILTELIEKHGFKEQTPRYRVQEQLLGPSQDRHFALE